MHFTDVNPTTNSLALHCKSKELLALTCPCHGIAVEGSLIISIGQSALPNRLVIS